MSFGLMIVTDAGKLLVLDDYLIPWRAGKCTIGTPGAWIDNGFAYEYRQTSITVPGSGVRLVAFTLPETTDDVWLGAINFLSAGSTMLMTEFRPAGSSVTPPTVEAYAFAVSAPPASSSGFGLQVWSAAGALTFDTNARHLGIRSLITHAFGNTNTAMGSLPAKPAFIFPIGGQHHFVGDGINNTSVLTIRQAAFRRTSSGLSSKYIDVESEGVDAYFDGTKTFGTTLPQAIPVINAAHYD